ncbi:DUF6922 domain-containing protein [Plebeiibacterium sediminum]|uniref:DUF6922 domain-containing protein n=1 Tax=Plebeiibacterium sediminum TaxID=2992112 RepID=A0AAE3SGJ5_9BACT|nr:hypothetical protein [Plebeiobacterium sediminum]MCW3788162.1 hypothetical protein [Plebeiobacterium sediminum]
MNTEAAKIRPNVSRRAFWDIDYNTIDWENNSQYLIIKVIERGKLQDLFELIKYYGKEKIKKELIGAQKLPQRTFDFARTYFAVNKEDFQCSISRL